jgi:hypothetical protein
MLMASGQERPIHKAEVSLLFLLIDGVAVADPSSETFYGMGSMPVE